MSASMPAHSGAAEDVPPMVIHPLGANGVNDSLKTVIAPVNSSDWAATSGTSRQGVLVVAPGTSAQKVDGNPLALRTPAAFL